MMLQNQKKITTAWYSFVILTLSFANSFAGEDIQLKCPSGFTHTDTKDYGQICYRLKGPENFYNKFTDCVANLYTSKLLLNALNIPKPNKRIWTEYKNLYPGGPFVDCSYTESLYEPTYMTVRNNNNLQDIVCVVREPDGNMTAVKCDEEHYSYCMVPPYEGFYNTNTDGCGYLPDRAIRFHSPTSTCLFNVEAERGSIRANWNQANELCAKHQGALLHRGWRYLNNTWFLETLPNRLPKTIPLGVVKNYDEDLKWINKQYGLNNVSSSLKSEWSFEESEYSGTYTKGALDNNRLILVNNTYTFYDVICEKSILLRDVNMVVYESDGQLVLLVNDTSIDQKNIKCFSDSVIFYPSNVVVESIGPTSEFALKPLSDGYYWCIFVDPKNYKVSESNKALFLREKNSSYNLYAIKIKVHEQYKLEQLNNLLKVWAKKLNAYMFLWYKYGAGENLNKYEIENKLRQFKTENSIEISENVINFTKLKQVYLDGRTVLLHVHVKPIVKVVKPAYWEGLEILYMKPAYFCSGTDILPSLPLGRSTTINNCEKYSCVGDFNGGVQWFITQGCTPIPEILNTTINVIDYQENDSSDQSDEVDTNMSTPEQQIQTVIEHLEDILHDEGAVPVETINNAFDQVDELLEQDEDLEIPSQFLHLLDELGGRADLNGTTSHATVRNNVAMVMADSEPEFPVRGLQITAGETTYFQEGNFELIRDELNTTLFDSHTNELVVSLPDSVWNSERRVSFVVFRNDRAFHPSVQDMTYTANSRVLSVNVQNVTRFRHGETVDLYFRPLVTESRNTTRACAFWQFLEDGSGVWSQEGCTFVRATQPGMLDTCRCTHLTHFAEILMPRSVFSDKNEKALEILSILGCVASIIGILIICLTAVIFRSWRRDFKNKIWLQLCLSILLLSIGFLVVVFADFQQYNVLCMLVGVLLHYSVLSSFCWMLIAAVISYRSLVLVFTRDASHKLLKASVFCWGAPCAIIGVLMSIAPHSYAGRFDEKTPNGSFCYPSGAAFWATVYAPIAIMLAANWTLFTLIVRSVFASRRIQRHGDTNEAFRCATVSCLLVFLFGLPWVFGLFASNIVGAYMFTLTSTFQGFVLFIFFVVGNKKTRDLWLNKLKITSSRKVPVTSSTYKSSGVVGWKTSGMNTSLEANNSKPRSLATADDSVFS